jgi:nucleotide-binding universal stress UspA family protein
MFKNIFIPFDGSELAESILPAAYFMAKKFDANLHFFHVLEKDAPKTVHGQPHLQTVNQAKKYLCEIAKYYSNEGITVNFHVHSHSYNGVAESIADHAISFGLDLIIMCSHGRSGLKKLLFGSIAQKVIHQSKLPVLTLFPQKNKKTPDFTCNRIQIPLDMDPNHQQGLHLAQEIAKRCDSILLLLQVIPTLISIPGKWRMSGKLLPTTSSKILDIQVDEAVKFLSEQSKKLSSQGFNIEIAVLRGDPQELISKAAVRYQAGLIILSTHSKFGMEAIWSGSVGAQLSGNHLVPIMFVPVF